MHNFKQKSSKKLLIWGLFLFLIFLGSKISRNKNINITKFNKNGTNNVKNTTIYGKNTGFTCKIGAFIYFNLFGVIDIS